MLWERCVLSLEAVAAADAGRAARVPSPLQLAPSPLVLCSWLSFKVKSGPANPQTVKGLSQRPGLRGARAESS